ncbi:hypothetical protein QA649_34560 [Bradyrhizobium sp. CB1717]|uniref:hypothetical protein n=1 Tax=Bradyrhizobium sp. CB1717 TaxID=3039154 RepID=UPI0024B13A39|nr:hypothetical protein [Bradyrhizobium sp. CB1717]WFU23166.1 hypothetical protein QA649_34560 [Bradyrhizobium sp. CB1717]
MPFKVTPASLADGTLKGESAKAFESLRAVLDEGGEAGPVDAGFSDGVLTVSRDAWRNRFYADLMAKEPSLDAEARKKRFQRTSGKLIEAGHVGALGDRVWLS